MFFVVLVSSSWPVELFVWVESLELVDSLSTSSCSKSSIGLRTLFESYKFYENFNGCEIRMLVNVGKFILSDGG